MLTYLHVSLALTTLAVAILALVYRHHIRLFAVRIDELEYRLDTGAAQSREALASYKLEVAKNYATVGLIKDSERRITEHLVRIEVKLDTARPTS